MTKKLATNGSNQPDMQPMRNCLKQVEENLDKIASFKADYIVACKEVHAEIADIYADAKQKGVNTQAVKVLVKTRQLEERIEMTRDTLDPDSDQDYALYAAAVEAWEATPLAQAAMRGEAEA